MFCAMAAATPAEYRTGTVRRTLQTLVKDESIFLSRFTQMELLQGCRDQREWTLLQIYLQEQDYIEQITNIWVAAARIYNDRG
jgi:predicted nucleic acid-binding protein